MEFVSSFYTNFVPWFLFLVMMAMGLSLELSHIKNVFKQPQAILTGLGAQLLLLPLIAICFGYLFNSPAVIAAGAIIVAACPGGVTSNAYVFAARGDVALSVSLTALASMITVFTIPLMSLLALSLYLESTDIPSPPIATMIWALAKFTVIPISIGMYVRARWSSWADNIIEPLRLATIISLFIVVVLGSIAAWDTIKANLIDAGLLMMSINITAMLLGYGLARLLNLEFKQIVSITFEVGVQNLSLALFVTLTFLQSPELAVSALTYALVMKLTAFPTMLWLIKYSRKHSI